MDLAKIRQKARQEQENRRPDSSDTYQGQPLESTLPHESPSVLHVSDDEDFFQNFEPASVQNVPQDLVQALPSFHSMSQRDPLEVILAGREAAGCHENLSIVTEVVVPSDTELLNYHQFLCFKVSDEVYGIDIMDIKEIIKPREVTEVPRSPAFVSGIISLRGVIVPIIDMRDRLGLAREKGICRERVIVVRHGDLFSGLLVDEIIQVVRVLNTDIEVAPPVLEGIDRDFVSGIGRADGRMIIVLNLSSIVDIHLY
jgi:purine-binding chemotaxis protein CheW